MPANSGPAILIPTGVLIPVASMSIRVLIGITHALDTPGNSTVLFNISFNFDVVIPARHWDFGFNCTKVSIIVKGAGSVAVSALPTLPNTFCTSGIVAISLSVCCSNSLALPTEIPG